MSRKAQLTIKNERLGDIIERVLKANKSNKEPDYGKMTPQEHGELVIGTYALDMVTNGFKIGVSLDFTYATLDKLPSVMRRNLQGYLDLGGSFSAAADALAKSFAAYIFCLAMNEHDCQWNVTQKRTKMTAPGADLGPLWAKIFQIKTGLDRQVDFLIPVMEGKNELLTNGKGLLTFNTDPLISAYNSAFNVDLSGYGLVNIVMDADNMK